MICRLSNRVHGELIEMQKYGFEMKLKSVTEKPQNGKSKLTTFEIGINSLKI